MGQSVNKVDSILQSLEGGEDSGKYYLNPEGAELNVPPIKIAQKFSDVNDYGKIKFDISGAADDSLIPMKTYRCSECKHINEDFKIDK